MGQPLVGYTCPACGFDTDVTNCDACDGIVKWDNDLKMDAHCSGCGRTITDITCRECGAKFTL